MNSIFAKTRDIIADMVRSKPMYRESAGQDHTVIDPTKGLKECIYSTFDVTKDDLALDLLARNELATFFEPKDLHDIIFKENLGVLYPGAIKTEMVVDPKGYMISQAESIILKYNPSEGYIHLITPISHLRNGQMFYDLIERKLGLEHCIFAPPKDHNSAFLIGSRVFRALATSDNNYISELYDAETDAYRLLTDDADGNIKEWLIDHTHVESTYGAYPRVVS